MEEGATLTIRSCKFDGRLHRSWRARLRRRAGPLLVVEGVFAEEVRHPLLGHIVRGTTSTEFFWEDRWYSVFRFREPSGRLRNFYCNLNTPPLFEQDLITFIDLDVDVLVAPDFSTRVVDEDEFERHAVEFQYPPEFRQKIAEALSELFQLITRRQFPFGPDEGDETL